MRSNTLRPKIGTGIYARLGRRRPVPATTFCVTPSGYALIPDYRAQIPADDRWGTVAYVRALQMARHATTADVPASELSKLDQPAAPAGGAAEHEKATEKAKEAGSKAGGGQE